MIASLSQKLLYCIVVVVVSNLVLCVYYSNVDTPQIIIVITIKICMCERCVESLIFVLFDETNI